MSDPEQNPMPTPWLYKAPSSLVVLISIAVGFVTFALPSAIEYWRWRHSFSLVSTIIISNAITGLLAATLHFTMIQTIRRRRTIFLLRLRSVAEMNHHVRNALEAIEMAASVSSKGVAGDQQAMLDIIRESTERIEWALREFLPEEPRQD